MDLRGALEQALFNWLMFIPLLTFHEWAHAWTAWKCGDNTAHKLGRVSLNPIVHMDLLGTVILPLAGMIAGAMGGGVMIVGWGKPVPVDPANLKRPWLQDRLIAMAGPAMNVLLAVALLLFVKLGHRIENNRMIELCGQMAQISLILCLFNLIPIPPLDGSHLIFNYSRMTQKAYVSLAITGFITVVTLLQFQKSRALLSAVMFRCYLILGRAVGLPGLDKY